MPSISQSRELGMTKLETGEWAYVPKPAAPPAIPAPSTAYPAAPNQYLRAPLPADMWEQPDGQRQFHASAIPQTRLSPLPANADPISGAQAASQAIQILAGVGTGTGNGTVTSVGLTVPGIFISPVSGSPVTTSGTLAVLLANEPFNTVFAGPSSTQGSLALDTTANTHGSITPAGVTAGTTQTNDFALALIEIDASIGALTAAAPTGWTQIAAIGTGGGTGGGVFWENVTGGVSASSAYSISGGTAKWGASIVTVKTSGGTPAVRQNQSAIIAGAAAPGGSQTLAFASNTLAGSTIFLVIQGLIGVLAPIQYQVSDSQGNNYSIVSTQNFPGAAAGQTCQQMVYAAPSSSAAACTITITNPTTGNGGPGITFYSLEVTSLAAPVLTPIFRALVSADLPGFVGNLLQPGAGGTGANLALTGGTHQFLRQNSAGAAITVVQPDYTDLAGVAIPTKYNNINTGGRGFPVERATVDLTAQTAAIAATTLFTVPALVVGAGMYRVSWVAKVTTPGTTSTLGGTNGFQCVYTDQDDSVVVTTPVWWGGGNNGAAPTSASLNTTQTYVGGELILNVALNTTVQYKFDYTSSGTAMQYNLHVKIEAL